MLSTFIIEKRKERKNEDLEPGSPDQDRVPQDAAPEQAMDGNVLRDLSTARKYLMNDAIVLKCVLIRASWFRSRRI